MISMTGKRILAVILAAVAFMTMAACAAAEKPSETEPVAADDRQQAEMEAYESEARRDDADEWEREGTMKMYVQIGNVTFTATLEDNDATRELTEMMSQGPVSIDMSDYGSFEKVGSLGRSLTTDNHQTTTTAGDIVLYNGNQIVMFYGSNAWSYTRIGRIDDLSGWEEALGSGDITAVFTLGE